MKKFYYFVTLSLFGLLFIWGGGCGNSNTAAPCESDKDCEGNYYCDTQEGKCKAKGGAEGGKEAVSKEKNKSDEEKPPVEKGGADGGTTDGGGSEAMPEKVVEKVPEGGEDICPPGCSSDRCKGKTATAKLKLGDPCQAPKSPTEKDPCAASGLVCVMNGIQNKGYCAKVCNTDADCKDLADTKCVERGDDKNKKICGKLVKEGEDCNYSAQNFCDNGLVCLISDVDRTAGTCYKPCQKDSECAKGKVCRNFSSQSTRKLCMKPILPGPKCLGEPCSAFSTAENCKEGLKCVDGVCVKGCDPKNGDKDCDTKAGEKCFSSPFSSNPPFCQPPPKVTEAGKKCDFYNQCDSKKGLKCVAVSQTESKCFKTCDPNKGEDNNPDCPADTRCTKLQSGGALCMKTVNTNEGCSGGRVCKEKLDICIQFSRDPKDAYCARLCNTKKNDKNDLNPDCFGGKGECLQLRSSITREGKSFDGICVLRPKTVERGGDCSFKGPDKWPGCKGDNLCVGLGGGVSICLPKCDPCKSELKGGEWVNPTCKDYSVKRCFALSNSSDGICLIDGKKVRNEGEYCDFQNGCKDGLLCIRFSSRDNAKSVCAKKCTPGPNAQAQCNGGRCFGLRGGGGVCEPLPKRKKKLGETCSTSLAAVGTPEFHDCLENDNGKKLICAQSPFPGAPRTCQIFCDPTKGFEDNADCKAAGLNNHLCLPADYRYPNKGACLEKCTFINRLTCQTSKCAIGQCRELVLGKRGSCKTKQDEQDCKNRGGKCVNNNCVASVCL